MRFLFVLSTLLLGFFMQIILSRYLSLYDAAPQIFLLLTVTSGFMLGPIMGEVLGFSWGLISDISGVRMFGMNALLLGLAGYLAGKLRRRVASERPTAQLVVSVVASLYYAIGIAILRSLFDEVTGHFSMMHLILEMIYNAVFVVAVFFLVEHWINLWRIPQEHM